MLRTPALLRCLLAVAALAAVSPATGRAAVADDSAASANHPQVRLDRLTLPADLAKAKEIERHLRSTLRREARRADWGGGKQAKVSYRFFVRQLDLREENGVLHVTCTALGRLPRGKSAKSHIVFGGDPRERKQVIERVLDIVARGVVTRLAELERARRTP